MKKINFYIKYSNNIITIKDDDYNLDDMINNEGIIVIKSADKIVIINTDNISAIEILEDTSDKNMYEEDVLREE